MIQTHLHINTTVKDLTKLEQSTFVNLIQLVISNSCRYSIIVYKTQTPMFNYKAIKCKILTKIQKYYKKKILNWFDIT